MTDTDLAVHVEGIEKRFGDVHALRGVTFSVPRGSVLGLLGPNGAGKTTVVNVLTTLSRPDGGSASVAGFDVVRDAANVRRSIMLTGQYAALDENLTARENLSLFGRLMGLDRSTAWRRGEELLDEFDLRYAADRRVKGFSGGMRRRIDIACGLVVRPSVVFLDEPTTGLDPRSRQAVWDLVVRLKEAGITTVLTTQYLEEADVLSDNIVVIDNGTVVAEGTADELKLRAGGRFCEVVPVHPADIPRLVEVLGDLVPPEALPAPDASRVSFPAPDGSATLGVAMHRIEATSIEIADIGLRRPSLDDVFFAITDRRDALAKPDHAAEADVAAGANGGPA